MRSRSTAAAARAMTMVRGGARGGGRGGASAGSDVVAGRRANGVGGSDDEDEEGGDRSDMLMDVYDDEGDEDADDYTYGTKNLRYYGFSATRGGGGVYGGRGGEEDEERNSEEEEGADMFADEEPDVDGDDAMM